jgi:ClpP class serine protease
VRSVRGKKPIVAYVGGMGASAAYWIASAADKIVAAPTAQLGSIGVIATYTDDRKAQEASGKTAISIVSSQSPKKNPDPSTDDGRAQIQQRIDAMARVFIGSVAENRGVSAAKVIADFGKGDVFVGADAVAAGLADEIGNFEAVVAELATRDNHRSNRMFMQQLAAAFGLDEKATEQEILTQAQTLASHDREACKFLGEAVRMTGAKGADEALGIIKANAESAAALQAMHVEQEKAAAAKVGVDFRAMLAVAVGTGGPMSLGQLAGVIPTMLDDEAAETVTAKIEALEKQDAESLLACFEGIEVSAKALSRASAASSRRSAPRRRRRSSRPRSSRTRTAARSSTPASAASPTRSKSAARR